MSPIAKFSWYGNIQFELSLLRTYVKSIEQQIDESVDTFHREKETHLVEIDPEKGHFGVFTTHKGLDDLTYDLETTFETYFPNLQRRSALITLFSFLEYQLDRLCRYLGRKRSNSITVSDLRDKGIDRSSLYLKKVAGLPIDDNSVTWQEIKNIQKVRNNIVHNDGKLEKDKNRDTIRKYIQNSEYLSDENEVQINDGYLSHVVKTFEDYFEEINKLLEVQNYT